jgi:hypothetical protein
MAGTVFVDGSDASYRILDRVIARATTEISLQMEWKILLRSIGKARTGHDHSRGAVAALERLRAQERLLHRMEIAVAGEPFNRRDLAALGAESRKKATVNWLAIKPDRASTAIAGITSFLHPEPAKAAQKRS